MPNDTIDVLARQAELGGWPGGSEPDHDDELPPAAIVQIETVRPEPPLVGSDRAWTIGTPAGRLQRLPRAMIYAAGGLLAAAALFLLVGKALMSPEGAAEAPAAEPAAPTATEASAATAPPAFEVTELVFSTSIDPATGSPGRATGAFEAGADVYLWMSFSSDGSGGAIDVTWRRGARKVGFTQTALPMSSTTMSMTLAGTATERAGQYRAQVRHDGKLVAEERFEVSNG